MTLFGQPVLDSAQRTNIRLLSIGAEERRVVARGVLVLGEDERRGGRRWRRAPRQEEEEIQGQGQGQEEAPHPGGEGGEARAQSCQGSRGVR